MGLLGRLLSFIWRNTLIVSGIALLILVIPGLPPYTTFKSIVLTPSLPKEGVLAPNNALDNANLLKIKDLEGPEAFQVHNGALYTTLGTGEVVKLSPQHHMTFVTKIGRPCEGSWQESKCGRPLGFRIDEDGKFLYVADAYYGIWKVDLKTDRKQLLVPPGVDIEGKAPMLFNSVALAKNGDVYWTDSSADFHLQDGSYTTLVDPSGRLFHYNAAKNQSRVLINGLWFANGVAISPNEEFVITNECLASRVHRYYISGPKKGQKDVFLDGIPGIIDNIQPIPDGSGVLIGLYKVFDAEHPMISRSLAPFPVMRKLFARLLRLIEMPVEYLNQHFPNAYFEKFIYTIGHFSSIAPLTPKSSGIIRVDWNGDIVGAWYNQDGTTSSISDAIVFNDLLYIGSPHNPFLATVPAPEQLKKAFSSKPAQVKKEEIKTKPQEKVPEPQVVKKTAEPVKESPKPVTEKPVVKPVTEKPVVKPVTEKPAVKPVTEKPIVKPVTEKPVVKPVEEKKPTPKPEEKKPQLKAAETKPVEKAAQPKAAEKPVTEKPVAAKPAEKKPTQTKPAENPKETQKTESTKKVDSKDTKQKPEQIPIVENIPVDTAKPTKEPLKVIKKGGPAEIPHPEL